jgi:hypothetical protein
VVIRAKELPTPLVWIEHWPQESTEGQETFDLVVFSSYKLEERVPYLGEPTWKPLDRASVESLIRDKV